MRQTGDMICANCGSSLSDEVCRVCGTPLVSASNIETVSPVLAGWWSRVGATVIDSMILIVPTLLLDLLLGSVLGQIAAVLAQAAYMIGLQTRSQGQTIGNRAVQTRVRDSLTGNTITSRQALIRWAFTAIYSVLEILSSASATTLTVVISLLALADCLYPLFNSRKQTLHDLVARTIVVRA